MKERPILFSGEMVRTILDDRKTQTRRVINLSSFGPSGTPGYQWHFRDRSGLWNDVSHERAQGLCPYGIPGDRLWLRETWRIASLPEDDAPTIQYRADGVRECCDIYTGDPGLNWDDKYEDWYCRISGQIAEDCQKAGLRPDGDGIYTWCWDAVPTRWRPSIHMPRWASRITLEVTGVRAERVRDISEDDCWHEGISLGNSGLGAPTYRMRFEDLWDSINSKPKPVYHRDGSGLRYISHYVSYPWEDVQEQRSHRGRPWYVNGNPWVWVVEFELIV